MDVLQRWQRWWVAGFVVLASALAVVVALVGWEALDGPGWRLARADASTVSRAIAEHVAEHGELPRISMTQLDGAGGATLWGDAFLVESRRVSRADPSRRFEVFVLGTADRWCVEVGPRSALVSLRGVSLEWVSAEGAAGHARRVVNGRCGADLLLHLTPVDRADPASPGSVIDVATATEGTCLWAPSAGGHDISDTLNETGHAEVVACDAAHLGEVYHAGELTDPSYPTARASAGEACATAFPLFVGVPENLSAFTTETVIVSEPRWQEGDRRFSCVLFFGGHDHPWLGSAKESWR
jgi:hypothetical protein